jgi:hypothetical protein
MSGKPNTKRISAFHLDPEYKDMCTAPIPPEKPKTDTNPFKQSGELSDKDTNLANKAAQSTAKLDDVLRLARETREIGSITMNELSGQGDRLRGLHGKLNQIDGDVSQANSLARKMKRSWWNPFVW